MEVKNMISLHEMKAQAAKSFSTPTAEGKAAVSYTAKEHEQIAGILKEYEFLKRWKDDMVNDFCKYDVETVDELIEKTRKAAIREFAQKLEDTYLSLPGIPRIEKDTVSKVINLVTEKLNMGYNEIDMEEASKSAHQDEIER